MPCEKCRSLQATRRAVGIQKENVGVTAHFSENDFKEL